MPSGIHPAHAAATAAGDGLGEDGESDVVGGRNEFVQVLGRRAGLQDRHAGVAGSLQRCHLVACQFQDFSGRPNERDARSLGCPGEVRVLGKEAVARVDCVRSGFLGYPHYFVNVQVCPDGVALFANQVGLVRFLAVDRVPVLMGEYGNGLGAQLVAGAEGPDRDFAAVGHQNFGKHTSPASLRVDR